jgi:hypothetical protein
MFFAEEMLSQGHLCSEGVSRFDLCMMMKTEEFLAEMYSRIKI